MYVKKFEGDSLDQTLQMVKKELGPDAIILKTVTNKGLKGALKKSRIEITAAISEQNYAKKMKVDSVLTDDQRDQFYQAPSQDINKSIKGYGNGGYGELGLNKVVNTVTRTSQKLKSSLDDFLSVAQPDIEEEHFPVHDMEPVEVTRSAPTQMIRQSKVSDAATETAIELKQKINSQQTKIDLLEQKIMELTQNLTLGHERDERHSSIKEVRTSLRTLDLNEKIIQNIIKKAQFELSEDELQDEEVVFDLVLRELSEAINVEMPMFSTVDNSKTPTITVLVSEGAVGQGTMALKLSTLCTGSAIVNYSPQRSVQSTFAKEIFNIEFKIVDSMAQVLSAVRNYIEEGKSVIVDLQASADEAQEVYKLLQTLKRSFKQVEALSCISAINSELYNRKILTKYKEIVNGVIISFMDQCMSFGAILNVHMANPDLPLKFYGTGAMVPDDIEAASAERLLASMFKL